MWDRVVPQDVEERQIAQRARKQAFISRLKEQLILLVILVPSLYFFGHITVVLVIAGLLESWFLFSRTVSTRWCINAALLNYRENEHPYKIY